MRLRDAAVWALGASLVKADGGPGGTSIGGQTPAGITFNESDFVADDVNLGINAIFNGRNGPIHNFNFQSTAQFIVNDVWVMRQEGGNPVAHGVPGVIGQSPLEDAGHAKVDSSLPSIKITTTTVPGGTSGQLSFNLYNFTPSVVAQPLFIQIDWARGTTSGGVTTSRIFAIANQNANRNEMEALVARFNGQLLNTTAAVAEVQPGTPTATDGTSPTVPSGGLMTTGLSGTTASTSTSTTQPTLADSEPSRNGLAVGAIAGIAVACGVVGIALVALLAFFLIRRNRRRAAAAPPYSNGRAHRTADLIAEKEATAGVTESPHSPYSDDGHGGGAAAMLAGHHGHQQQQQHHQQGGLHSETASFAPYSDGRHTPGVRESVALESEAGTEHMSGATAVRGGDRGGASTQMSGRYAHLMEEGMTPEERARIEEEERHLDVAIEQAAPRR